MGVACSTSNPCNLGGSSTGPCSSCDTGYLKKGHGPCTPELMSPEDRLEEARRRFDEIIPEFMLALANPVTGMNTGKLTGECYLDRTTTYTLNTSQGVGTLTIFPSKPEETDPEEIGPKEVYRLENGSKHVFLDGIAVYILGTLGSIFCGSTETIYKSNDGTIHLWRKPGVENF